MASDYFQDLYELAVVASHKNHIFMMESNVICKGILINGQIPGPQIDVVTNDNLIINVYNYLKLFGKPKQEVNALATLEKLSEVEAIIVPRSPMISVAKFVIGSLPLSDFSNYWILDIGRLKVLNAKLVFWDLGGQPGLHSIWEKYYEEAHVVIYVIDAACPSKFEDSKFALGR
ncbi:ADP-ribosylation factor-like protein 8 [Benincasa hispida]|uniref:ADP-ribosylation factor-like protein 8 n=1 Tax=Benincasa hispida TaxID=102211 RepID=UPI0018FFB9B8|nr:ADP-ribosylation factor-like protein 8 [Benincasa hispida]